MPRINRDKVADVYRVSQTPTFFETLCMWVGRIVIFIVIWIVLGITFGG